ncbi:MAG: META domain-containing protein [Paracoccus sp. (in: a-proteobacteria)]
MTKKAAIIALAVAALAGCTAPGIPEAQRIDGIDWKLVQLDGLPREHDVSLRIDGDRLTGIGPCNAYAAAQAATAPGFSAQRLSWTDMPCTDPGRQTAEMLYANRLMRVESMQRDRATLVLSGPYTQMIFERREARGDEVF